MSRFALTRHALWAPAGGLLAAGVVVSWIWLHALPAGAATFTAVFGRLAVVACGLICLAATGHGLARRRAARHGPPRRLDDRGGPLRGLDDQGGPVGRLDDRGGPLGRLDDQAGALSSLDDRGGRLRGADDQRGPLGRSDDRGGPLRGLDDQAGPLGRLDDQRRALRGADDQRGPLGRPDDRGGPLRRLEAAGAAVALLGGLLAAASIPPEPPRAGIPLLRDLSLAGQATSVLVVPQRPGWNLVHVSATEAAVGLDPFHLTAATPRPGATGLWTLVRLPAGPSKLLILHDGGQTVLPVNTGRGAPLTGIAGPDGPECVSATLGALTAGADQPVRSCPDQRLAPADAQALRGMIRFIAQRGIHQIAVVADSSPRSAQAEQLVLALCRQDGIAVHPPKPAHTPGLEPIVMVSGWQRADQVLGQIAGDVLQSEGAYLAPWLLDAPLLSHPAGQLIPLRFDPRDPATLRYVTQLSARFPGELPTAAGYAAWLAAKRETQRAAVHLYAASLVFDPSEGAHSEGANQVWLPTGTLADVSTPLDGH